MLPDACGNTIPPLHAASPCRYALFAPKPSTHDAHSMRPHHTATHCCLLLPPPCIMVQVDVEGYETMVVRSMTKLTKNHLIENYILEYSPGRFGGLA